MLRAKKSLGQHFLADRAALRTVIETARSAPADTILEIGPGGGSLTEALLETGARVIAIEKDDRLIPTLQQKFSEEMNSGQFTLIRDDILTYKLQTKSYKLIANIPYYLTGQIIRQFLTAAVQPLSMTLMLQKEVAERIVAANKKESLLSIAVKAYGAPRYIKTVPRGAFRPAPKVDSAILHIDNISRRRFNENEVTEREFFSLLHRGFAAKRKVLGPKLKLAEEKLRACGVSPQARAENLTLNQWLCLAKYSS